MAVTGGCECGSVRYALSSDHLPPVICCHCRDCQTRTGSAFDETAFVDPAEFDVTGPLVTTVRRTPNGFDATYHMCGSCQTVIHVTHFSSNDRLLVRAGTFDNSETVVPMAHIFVKRKQPWIELSENVPTFEEFPTAEDLARLLGRG